MVYLGQRPRIIRRLGELKFELEQSSNGSRRFDFVRDANVKIGRFGGLDLETFLRLHIRGIDRIGLSMHSNPWPKVYNFSTKGDVSEEQFFEHIKGYFEAMREGNRYLS